MGPKTSAEVATEVTETIVSLTDEYVAISIDTRLELAISNALRKPGSKTEMVISDQENLAYAVVASFRRLHEIGVLDFDSADRISACRGPMPMEPPFTEQVPPIPLMNGSQLVLLKKKINPFPSKKKEQS